MKEETNEFETKLKKEKRKNVVLCSIIVILLLMLFILPSILKVTKSILPERWLKAMESTFECECPIEDGSNGINGSTTIEDNGLKVSFDSSSIIIDSNSGFTNDSLQVNQTGSSINFNVVLKEPNDYATFYVTLVNNGDFDAEIVGLETNILTDKEAEYIKYSITYEDGTPINIRKKMGSVELKGDIIKRGKGIKLKFTAIYRDDFAVSLKEDLVVPFKSKITFAQAD